MSRRRIGALWLCLLLCAGVPVRADTAARQYAWTVEPDVPLFAELGDAAVCMETIEAAHTPLLILVAEAGGAWLLVMAGELEGYVRAADTEAITAVEAALAASTVDFSSGKPVWIPTNGGNRYHRRAGCSSMIDPEKVTLRDARALGFTPCGRCRPGQ